MDLYLQIVIEGYDEIGTSSLVSELVAGAPFVTGELSGEIQIAEDFFARSRLDREVEHLLRFNDRSKLESPFSTSVSRLVVAGAPSVAGELSGEIHKQIVASQARQIKIAALQACSAARFIKSQAQIELLHPPPSSSTNDQLPTSSYKDEWRITIDHVNLEDLVGGKGDQGEGRSEDKVFDDLPQRDLELSQEDAVEEIAADVASMVTKSTGHVDEHAASSPSLSASSQFEGIQFGLRFLNREESQISFTPPPPSSLAVEKSSPQPSPLVLWVLMGRPKAVLFTDDQIPLSVFVAAGINDIHFAFPFQTMQHHLRPSPKPPWKDEAVEMKLPNCRAPPKPPWRKIDAATSTSI